MIRNRFFLLCAAVAMAACQASTNDSARSDQPAASDRPTGRAATAVPTPEPLVIPQGTALAMTLQTTASSATSRRRRRCGQAPRRVARRRVLGSGRSEVRGVSSLRSPPGSEGVVRVSLSISTASSSRAVRSRSTPPRSTSPRSTEEARCGDHRRGHRRRRDRRRHRGRQEGRGDTAPDRRGARGRGGSRHQGQGVHLPQRHCAQVRLKEPARIA